MTPFTHLFISKSRKVNCELSLIIRELANVPFVSGYYYVNWKLKNASHTTGSTERIHIKDHQVTWNHPINTMLRLVLNKQRDLGRCELKLEIYKKGDSKMIGSLCINLSSYSDSGVTTERFLLQNCKFNSTIKLTLRLNIKTDSEDTVIPSSLVTQPSSHQHRASERQKNEELNSNTIKSTKVIKSLPPPLLINTVRKSQSLISLPRYCNIQSSFEQPSPIDFVEQLFANTPTSVRVQV